MSQVSLETAQLRISRLWRHRDDAAIFKLLLTHLQSLPSNDQELLLLCIDKRLLIAGFNRLVYSCKMISCYAASCTTTLTATLLYMALSSWKCSPTPMGKIHVCARSFAYVLLETLNTPLTCAVAHSFLANMHLYQHQFQHYTILLQSRKIQQCCIMCTYLLQAKEQILLIDDQDHEMIALIDDKVAQLQNAINNESNRIEPIQLLVKFNSNIVFDRLQSIHDTRVIHYELLFDPLFQLRCDMRNECFDKNAVVFTEAVRSGTWAFIEILWNGSEVEPTSMRTVLSDIYQSLKRCLPDTVQQNAIALIQKHISQPAPLTWSDAAQIACDLFEVFATHSMFAAVHSEVEKLQHNFVHISDGPSVCVAFRSIFQLITAFSNYQSNQNIICSAMLMQQNIIDVVNAEFEDLMIERNSCSLPYTREWLSKHTQECPRKKYMHAMVSLIADPDSFTIDTCPETLFFDRYRIRSYRAAFKRLCFSAGLLLTLASLLPHNNNSLLTIINISKVVADSQDLDEYVLLAKVTSLSQQPNVVSCASAHGYLKTILSEIASNTFSDTLHSGYYSRFFFLFEKIKTLANSFRRLCHVNLLVHSKRYSMIFDNHDVFG